LTFQCKIETNSISIIHAGLTDFKKTSVDASPERKHYYGATLNVIANRSTHPLDSGLSAGSSESVPFAPGVIVLIVLFNIF